MKNSRPTYELKGIFYTHEDGALSGYAWSDGEYWYIPGLGKDVDPSKRWGVYLDKEKQIPAPKNPEVRSFSEIQSKKLLDYYKNQVKILKDDPEVLKLSHYRMMLQMFELRLEEYRKIYFEHFMPTSVRFILGLF